MRYAASVIRGKGRGKRIGIPTVNFRIPESFPYPYGIYAGWVYMSGKRYRAAFHFGPIPVFKEPAPSLEAFLIGVRLKENPPRRISFAFIQRIRAVRKFANAALLKRQIGKDVSEVKRALGAADRTHHAKR